MVDINIDAHPMRYSVEQRKIERLLQRRLIENRLDGHLLETSLEILDAFNAVPFEEVDALEAQLARAREALEPFAKLHLETQKLYSDHDRATGYPDDRHAWGFESVDCAACKGTGEVSTDG